MLGTALLFAVVLAVPPLRQAALLGASRVVLFVATPLTPDIAGFEDLPVASQVVASDGTVLGSVAGGERREPVRLRDLSPEVRHAVLAAEDARFYRHDGVDPMAVARAFIRTGQGRKQGGSTITQQLAKINYTDSERTVLRKLREVLYAARLERKYTKDELLERYLNQVYFGDGSYGIDAAARSFFGVPASDLNAAQAATLAGVIRAPEAYDLRAKPAAVKARRDQVLGNMRRHGWLHARAARDAAAAPIETVPAASASGAPKAPHFVEFVRREAAALDALGGTPESRAHQLVSGGYRIETTLDVKAYDIAEATVRDQLGLPEDPATAVVSVQPGDGAIRVLFGGLGFDRKFDLASQGTRQPGSSFKPFVYLAALRDGIDPRSVLDASSPKQLEYKGSPYTVNNYEGEGGGTATIDDAMVESINTVFSQVALEAGPSAVVDAATRAGINEERLKSDRERPSVALGGLRNGVTPLEMASAYATFAANGEFANPYAIARIKNRNGEVVYNHQGSPSRAFDRREVAVLNRPLIDVVQRGTGTAARFGPVGAVAGKTGTTQKYGDAWFVGYTQQLATSVWVGYPDAVKPMIAVHGRKVSGGSFPAAIFGTYMRQALAGQKLSPLETATPDSLGLRMLGTTSTTTSSSTSSTTSSTTSTTAAPGAPPPAPPTTRRADPTTTTERPRQTSSSSTTSTTAKPKQATATTAG